MYRYVCCFSFFSQSKEIGDTICKDFVPLFVRFCTVVAKSNDPVSRAQEPHSQYTLCMWSRFASHTLVQAYPHREANIDAIYTWEGWCSSAYLQYSGLEVVKPSHHFHKIECIFNPYAVCISWISGQLKHGFLSVLDTIVIIQMVHTVLRLGLVFSYWESITIT